MNTILVLGGGGFLAGVIEGHFSRAGWKVIAVGRGASSSSAQIRHVWQLPHQDFAHLLAVEKPQLCINAAGKASVPASMVEPFYDFQASTALNAQILDDIRRRSPDTAFVLLSSAAVYGNPGSLPVAEEDAIAPISPYGWHRRMSELVVEEYVRLFGLRAAALRIFSTYGRSLKRQAVWEIVSRALAAPSQPLVLKGIADDSRDFLHATDIARAVEVVWQRGAMKGEVYNAASGVETSMQSLGKLIASRVGMTGGVRFDGISAEGYPHRWQADVKRLSGLGFSPSIDLDTGIQEIIQEARASIGR